MSQKNLFKDLYKRILLNAPLLVIITLLVLATGNLKAQQEAMYSQYMFNMVQINPAYAGNRAVDNVTTMFRKQWVGIEGAPTTANLSWDRRETASNIGYGAQIYTDRIGIESTVGVQGFYSYRIPFLNSSLALGLSAGVLNYRAEYTKLTTMTASDPLFAENINGFRPTVGFGALYATENWYAGFSIPALLQTKITESNLAITTGANNHYFLTGGYIFDVSPDVKLKPSVLFKAVQGAPLEVDLNLNAWIQDVIGLGVSYRTGDALIGMFEVQLSPQIRLGYAYDYTLSYLKSYSKGTHELMLRYEFGSPKTQQVLSPRYY
jgi:type IX secretion system PorP/SprF family membrane protein